MSLVAGLRRRINQARIARLGPDQLRARIAARPGVMVLCYHSIGGALPGYAWRTAPDAFAAQLAILADLCDVVPLEEAMGRLAARDPRPRPLAVLTFDDAFLDNLTIATPILEKAGLPATLFAPRDLVRRGGTTHMGEDGLKAIARHPLWTLGAHGITHNVLPGFTAADQRRELQDSRDWLADLSGTRPRAFAYPQGAICETSVAQARDLYDWGLSTDRRLGPGYDAHQLRRFCPTEAQDAPHAFLGALYTIEPEDGIR